MKPKSSQQLLDEQAELDAEIKKLVIDGEPEASPRITLSADQLDSTDRMRVVLLARKSGSSYQATLKRLFRAVLAQAESDFTTKGK